MPRAALETRRYRPGPSTDVNLATVREPAFYEALLDTMVASRLNVLSLWAVHPWPYMIRSVEWPEATSFNSTEVCIQSSAITLPCIDTGNDSTDPTTVKAPCNKPPLEISTSRTLSLAPPDAHDYIITTARQLLCLLIALPLKHPSHRLAPNTHKRAHKH